MEDVIDGTGIARFIKGYDNRYDAAIRPNYPQTDYSIEFWDNSGSNTNPVWTRDYETVINHNTRDDYISSNYGGDAGRR